MCVAESDLLRGLSGSLCGVPCTDRKRCCSTRASLSNLHNVISTKPLLLIWLITIAVTNFAKRATIRAAAGAKVVIKLRVVNFGFNKELISQLTLYLRYSLLFMSCRSADTQA